MWARQRKGAQRRGYPWESGVAAQRWVASNTNTGLCLLTEYLFSENFIHGCMWVDGYIDWQILFWRILNFPNAQVCTKFREFSTTIASDIYVPGFFSTILWGLCLQLWSQNYNSAKKFLLPSDAGVSRPTVLPVTVCVAVAGGRCLAQVQPKHGCFRSAAVCTNLLSLHVLGPCKPHSWWVPDEGVPLFILCGYRRTTVMQCKVFLWGTCVCEARGHDQCFPQ